MHPATSNLYRLPCYHGSTNVHGTDLQELTFCEFFAGEGNVWRCLRADSVQSLGVDIEYWDSASCGDRQNPFDILTTAGLGWGPQK